MLHFHGCGQTKQMTAIPSGLQQVRLFLSEGAKSTVPLQQTSLLSEYRFTGGLLVVHRIAKSRMDGLAFNYQAPTHTSLKIRLKIFLFEEA